MKTLRNEKGFALVFVLVLAAIAPGCDDDETTTASSTGDAPCAKCAEVANGTQLGNSICRGDSEDALEALNICVCGLGASQGGGGAGGDLTDCRHACFDDACQAIPAGDACLECIQTICADPFDTCQAN